MEDFKKTWRAFILKPSWRSRVYPPVNPLEILILSFFEVVVVCEVKLKPRQREVMTRDE